MPITLTIHAFRSSHNVPGCLSSHVGTFNSLAPGRFQWNLRKIIFKLILVTNGCDISSEIALRWTSLVLSDDKSTLVQVMAWCRQARSQYLNQCWPRSSRPYVVTRPQWVNSSPLHKMAIISQMTFWNAFSWMEMYEFHLRSHKKFVPRIWTKNIPTLVQIMAWCRLCDKLLSEPMLTQFTNAYIRH